MRIFLLILVLAIGTAWSSEPKQPDSRGGQQQANTEQRGSEKVPIFVKGDITTEKNKEEAKNDADERKVKAETEAALVKYTGLLALFTFLLFCFTAALWWVTYKLSRDAKVTSDRQAREMEKSLAIAESNAKTAEDSIDLARREFLSTNRPKLIVRWIYFNGEETIEYEITNIGGLGAEIVAMHTEVCLDDLPALAPYTDKPGMTVPLIHAGEPRKIECVVISDIAVGELQKELGWNHAIAEGPYSADARKIYFLGYISYKDSSIGISHRTAFCRLYDYRKRRFMPIADADPDYEHAD